MDKPLSLSVKDFLIRKMSVDFSISEDTIRSVVDHQCSNFLTATKTNDSLELSGWGTFYFQKKKALKRLNTLNTFKTSYERQLNDGSLSPLKRTSLERKLLTATKDEIELKERIGNEL